MTTQQLLNKTAIIPVVTIEHADHAVALAEALLAGGIAVMEVTLRTTDSLRAIENIAKNVPDMLIGVGTILKLEQFKLAKNAGAQFFISPGFTNELGEFAKKENLCFLPGVTSPSEIMQAANYGLNLLKFFPAEASGGIAVLKAISPVFPEIKFCPTGGISRNNMNDYLQLNNVACIGGSWLTPAKLLNNKDWPAVTAIARDTINSLNMPVMKST